MEFELVYLHVKEQQKRHRNPTSTSYTNISSISNDINSKHSNTHFYFQNCFNTIKIQTIP